MTSDAIRQPGEPTRPAPESTAPGASEALPPEPDETASTPPDHSAAPSSGEVNGQAAAASEAATAESISAAEAASPAETVTTAQAVAATQAAAADKPAAATPRRRERVSTFTRRLAVFAVGVALLVGGIALGVTIFQSTRAASTVPPLGQVGTTPDQPALVAQEFIGALRASDFDGMRSAMQPEAALHFNDEIERRGVITIDKVEVLGTHVAGQRSATEILVQYKNDQDLPLSINLVILVDGGKIEGFR
jgi:hypothetical protein